MSHKNALLSIFVMSIAGILFSGYLSYQELFTEDGCQDTIVQCGDSGFTIADLPACVYGFAMYLVIFLISATSLFLRRESRDKGEEKLA